MNIHNCGYRRKSLDRSFKKSSILIVAGVSLFTLFYQFPVNASSDVGTDGQPVQGAQPAGQGGQFAQPMQPAQPADPSSQYQTQPAQTDQSGSIISGPPTDQQGQPYNGAPASSGNGNGSLQYAQQTMQMQMGAAAMMGGMMGPGMMGPGMMGPGMMGPGMMGPGMMGPGMMGPGMMPPGMMPGMGLYPGSMGAMSMAAYGQPMRSSVACNLSTGFDPNRNYPQLGNAVAPREQMCIRNQTPQVTGQIMNPYAINGLSVSPALMGTMPMTPGYMGPVGGGAYMGQ